MITGKEPVLPPTLVKTIPSERSLKKKEENSELLGVKN